MKILKNKFVPLLFGVIIAILMLLVLPFSFPKHNILVEGDLVLRPFDDVHFADVNGDGFDEIIRCTSTNPKHTSAHFCVIEKFHADFVHSHIAQINFDELLADKKILFSADVDQNGKEDIFVFNVKGDSLFLEKHTFKESNFLRQTYFLDSIIRHRNRPLARFGFLGLKDMNGDGISEVFFGFRNAYPIYPRKLYRVDVSGGEVISSPSLGFGFREKGMQNHSLIGNVITGMSHVSNNFLRNPRIPFPDTAGYVAAFDLDLQFLNGIEPIPVVNHPGACNNVVIGDNLYSFLHDLKSGTGHLQKRDLEYLEVQKQISIDNLVKGGILDFNGNLLWQSNRRIHLLDEDLSTRRSVSCSLANSMKSIDLNNDGVDELLLTLQNNAGWQVFDHSLKYSYNIPLPYPNASIVQVANLSIGPRLVISDGESKLCFVSFSLNPHRWFSIPYVVIVFGCSIFFSVVGFNLFAKSIQRKYEQNAELNRLQMLALKNQIDPHFTLNALNTIDWMYMNKEEEKARQFLGKISRLMQKALTSSQTVHPTLYEELDFCRNFCELQVLKLNDFTFKIEVDADIDPESYVVPKQCIFTHVENALKHGLSPLDGKKTLHISISKQPKFICIKITDNGVGYKEKSETSGTQRGLGIANEINKTFKKITGRSTAFFVKNLKKGTLVEVFVEF
ncbi:MAG: histidine kinase [Cryomorphaceae bacterium]|nr:histidine kinase [Cryomorphaceae bacterium]